MAHICVPALALVTTSIVLLLGMFANAHSKALRPENRRERRSRQGSLSPRRFAGYMTELNGNTK